MNKIATTAAIITAATLIFLFSAFGLLDFPRIFVNHSYLASQTVGGLIMGVLAPLIATAWCWWIFAR